MNVTTLPKRVTLVEVSPRDGLQNEPASIPTAVKVDFINRLSETGLKSIEVTSFVSPQKIPQLADNQKVYDGIHKKTGISYPVLIPNIEGLNNALCVGATDIAVFAAASESFSKKNINCSIDESLTRIQKILEVSVPKGLRVRGYISCVLGCPYEGEIEHSKVADLAKKLLALGCYEISLGDTIGTGTPLKTAALIDELLKKSIPVNQIAMHCHDTYGQALANIYAALEKGVTVFDASVAGLGGCPYAQGATGNVATEDLLYMLNGLGIKTGVDLIKLIDAGNFISDYLKRKTNSKVALAYRNKKRA